MSDVGRLEQELAIAKLVEEYEALRSKVEGPKQNPGDMARYRELNDQIAAARTAFKEQYPPDGVAAGDAAATPEPVVAKTK